MYPPEIKAQIPIWREKALKGTLTLEETKTFIAKMREARQEIEEKPAAKTARKSAAVKKPAIDADDLLNQLM